MIPEGYIHEKLMLANAAMAMIDTDPGDPPPFWRVVSLARWMARYRAYRAGNACRVARTTRERLVCILREARKGD